MDPALREALDRIEEELRLSREERAEMRRERAEDRRAREEDRLRHQQEREDMRVFLRDLMTRYERNMQAVAERLEDLGDQVRASTEATWAMLDRFRNGPGRA